eukprot:GILI01028920.1.p1 GENE.GILI01028920.1~~GILI01028920.1.p1  ORF type:complete len:331 (+),score=71.12 GILI01028920.1:99-1091(+)
MGRGARSKFHVRKTGKRYELAADTPTEVDPKLMEKYKSVRQADRKRDLYSQIKEQNKNAKRARREMRKAESKNLKERAPAKLIPKTKERLRRADETVIENDKDPEILKDEEDDEFSAFFKGEHKTKILITTGEKPCFRTKQFVKEALWLFPNSIYRPRKDYSLKEITQFCINRGFSDLMVITDRLKQPFNMILSHLPHGPTSTFRISNFLMHKELDKPAERTEHYPELIFKNFDTRLGRRIGRQLEALFPRMRDYEGRAVATFHNQRDYCFLRCHRYVFDSTKEVRIQEMGPRFTLRLLTLQSGTFDSKFGEFEWYRKKVHDTDKLEWYM